MNNSFYQILKTINSKIRQHLADNTDLRIEIVAIKYTVERISKKQEGQNKNIDLVFEYIDRLQDKIEEPLPKERKKICFKVSSSD